MERKGEPMMNLTREEALDLFRRHWRWLAETGAGLKVGWPEHDFAGEPVTSDCFLCEYSCRRRDPGEFFCAYCPIEWPEGRCYSQDDNETIYSRWCSVDTAEERKQIAAVIAELPEKEAPHG